MFLAPCKTSSSSESFLHERYFISPFLKRQAFLVPGNSIGTISPFHLRHCDRLLDSISLTTWTLSFIFLLLKSARRTLRCPIYQIMLKFPLIIVKRKIFSRISAARILFLSNWRNLSWWPIKAFFMYSYLKTTRSL